MRTVGIIGGGATGTLVAAHLARVVAADASATPVRVVIFEPRAELGRGVAYGTDDPLHLLNVRASNMSCDPSDPTHFVRWSGLEPSNFARRNDYGRYLREFLDESLLMADERLHFHHRQWWVSAVEPHQRGGFTVRGDTDEQEHCDELVLAIGHGSRNLPSWLDESLADDPHIVIDPWTDGALEGLHAGSTVAIVGTGLTFIDLVLSLDDQGVSNIIGISRHGLLPRPHAAHGPHVASPDLSTLTTPRAALRWIRSHGAAWREAFDALRPHLPALWGQWSLDQRRQFLRHAVRYWDVHRHRMPESSAARMAELTSDGRVTIVSSAVTECVTSDAGVRITLTNGQVLDVDRVILAAGASDDFRGHPVVESLLGHGIASNGPLGMGLDVDPGDGRLIQSGEASPHHSVLTIGSVRRGVSWETTAIPELRVQATAVAALLYARISSPATASDVLVA